MLWHIHFRPLLLHPSSGADPSPVALSAPRPQGLERRARLAGYCEFARFHRGHRQVDCGFSGAYRCPDLLLSDYVFCPGEYPLASDSPDEVVYLAKVCDAKNLLGIFDGHVDHYSEVRVFNNFTNEREGRQIGGQRGRNIQECKISGPSSFLPAGSDSADLHLDPMPYATDRKDFYHQVWVSESKMASNAVGPAIPIDRLRGLQAYDDFAQYKLDGLRTKRER